MRADRESADVPFAPARLPRKNDVDPRTFHALDVRVGRVEAVEDFTEARKPAWKLWVDFGPEVGTLRTSAQIRGYPREALLGCMVVGVVNMGVKRIAGFESEFLVLGALDPDGAVRLLQVDEDLPPGAPVA